MTQEKPLLVFLPNVLFHLDACLLPTNDPSPAATGPAAASNTAGPGHPQIHRHCCQGARNPLTHRVSLSVCPGKGNLYPAADNCGRCLQNAQTLLHMGAEDGKRHPVYNARTLYLERTLLTPTMISIICCIMLTLIPLSHLISRPSVLMCEVLRTASQTMSPNVLSHVVLQLG